MAEQIARFPLHHLTVKAEEETLLAGRLVTFKSKNSEGDYTAVHAAENAADVLGCVQRDTTNPKASPAPDPHDNELRTAIVRGGSIARVLADGEVKAGEKVMTATGGKVKKVGEGKNAVGVAVSTGKDVIIEVELYG